MNRPLSPLEVAATLQRMKTSEPSAFAAAVDNAELGPRAAIAPVVVAPAAKHNSDLDRRIVAILTHHDAEFVMFAPCGVLHTAYAYSPTAWFVGTAQTSALALGLAMTGLRAAIGGAA